MENRKMENSLNRKKYFHKESSQGRYILSYFIVAGITILLFTLIFGFFVYDSLSITYDNYNLRLGKTPAVFFEQFLETHGLLIFFGGLAILFVATRLTHRSAGPLFKMEQALEEMIAGKIEKEICLRSHDDHKRLAEKINRLSAMLSSNIKEVKKILEEAEAMYEREKVVIDSNHSPLEYVEFKKIKSHHERLKEVLSTFKLSG